MATVTASPVKASAKPSMSEVDVFGITDPGNVRSNNADHFLLASFHRAIRVPNGKRSRAASRSPRGSAGASRPDRGRQPDQSPDPPGDADELADGALLAGRHPEVAGRPDPRVELALPRGLGEVHEHIHRLRDQRQITLIAELQPKPSRGHCRGERGQRGAARQDGAG